LRDTVTATSTLVQVEEWTFLHTSVGAVDDPRVTRQLESKSCSELIVVELRGLTSEEFRNPKRERVVDNVLRVWLKLKRKRERREGRISTRPTTR
jgi:hypothetical protein